MKNLNKGDIHTLLNSLVLYQETMQVKQRTKTTKFKVSEKNKMVKI